MAEVSKNSMDFIKVAGEKIKGKFGKAFLGTLMMVAPLMLCVFTVYALPLAILFFGVFETGYIRFMRALIAGENPSYKLIFSEFKTPWLEIFLGTIMIIMFALGTILAIIPGAILIAYYSMALFVAEKDKIADAGVALKETSKKMNGNIAGMFAYKTFFWVFYIVAFFVGLIIALCAVKLWNTHLVYSLLILLADYCLITILWSVITVYYHTANELFFVEMLTYNEIKKTRKANKVVEIINEVNEEEKVETKPVVDEKVEVAEQPVKTPAKKTTTKKASATAEQPATRKTTNKKTTK